MNIKIKKKKREGFFKISFSLVPLLLSPPPLLLVLLLLSFEIVGFGGVHHRLLDFQQ